MVGKFVSPLRLAPILASDISDYREVSNSLTLILRSTTCLLVWLKLISTAPFLSANSYMPWTALIRRSVLSRLSKKSWFIFSSYLQLLHYWKSRSVCHAHYVWQGAKVLATVTTKFQRGKAGTHGMRRLFQAAFRLFKPLKSASLISSWTGN